MDKYLQSYRVHSMNPFGNSSQIHAFPGFYEQQTCDLKCPVPRNSHKKTPRDIQCCLNPGYSGKAGQTLYQKFLPGHNTEEGL